MRTAESAARACRVEIMLCRSARTRPPSSRTRFRGDRCGDQPRSRQTCRGFTAELKLVSRAMRILSSFVLVLGLATAAACGGPSRTTYARYPTASATFDRASQDPKALAVADKVIATAGGAAAWEKAKQLRWSQSIVHDGKEVLGGEQAWDRWNGRQYGRAHREGGDIVVIRDIYGSTENAYMDPGNGKPLKKIEGGSDTALSAARD